MTARLGVVVFFVLTSCGTFGQATEWITPGVTTQDEVVEYFGPPDVSLHHPPFYTAIYRGRRSVDAVPPLLPPIPQIVPTLRGPVPMDAPGVERMQPSAERQARRPPEEFRVSYDQGHVVTDVQPGPFPDF